MEKWSLNIKYDNVNAIHVSVIVQVPCQKLAHLLHALISYTLQMPAANYC